GAHGRRPHVEVRVDGGAELLVEGVDVGPAVGVVEGQLPFVAVQLHPDALDAAQGGLQARGVGGSVHLDVDAGQVIDVPEAGAIVVVEGPLGAAGRPSHPHPPVRDAAQVHLPGATHLVVFQDGLVGTMGGPKILHFIPQGGLHVLQLGL
ncbi:hypothetical protein N307_13635, partial [Dryobates pubescens]